MLGVPNVHNTYSDRQFSFWVLLHPGSGDYRSQGADLWHHLPAQVWCWSPQVHYASLLPLLAPQRCLLYCCQKQHVKTQVPMHARVVLFMVVHLMMVHLTVAHWEG